VGWVKDLQKYFLKIERSEAKVGEQSVAKAGERSKAKPANNANLNC
jgi:hypothetical protein